MQKYTQNTNEFVVRDIFSFTEIYKVLVYLMLKLYRSELSHRARRRGTGLRLLGAIHRPAQAGTLEAVPEQFHRRPRRCLRRLCRRAHWWEQDLACHPRPRKPAGLLSHLSVRPPRYHWSTFGCRGWHASQQGRGPRMACRKNCTAWRRERFHGPSGRRRFAADSESTQK